MANWGQLRLQDAASPVIAQLITFHDHAMAIIVLIITLVGYGLFSLCLNRFSSRYIFEAQAIETIWTVLPAIILLFLVLTPILYKHQKFCKGVWASYVTDT